MKFKSSNEQYEPTFDIFTSRIFQTYKEGLTWTRFSICTFIPKNWNNLKLEFSKWIPIENVWYSFPFHFPTLWECEWGLGTFVLAKILSHAPNVGVSPKLGSQHFTQSQFTKNFQLLLHLFILYTYYNHQILKMYDTYFELRWKMFYIIQSIKILPNLQEWIVSYMFTMIVLCNFNFITLHVSIHSKHKL